MSRVGAHHSCRVCGTFIGSIYLPGTLAENRLNIRRQILNGLCDSCQRARHAAAILLIRFADEIRLYNNLGLPVPESVLRGARKAEDECVRLKMWSGTGDAPADRFRKSVSSKGVK